MNLTLEFSKYNMTSEHCFVGRRIVSFLQDDYNKYRDEGGDHSMYIAKHDFSDKLGEELRRNYELQKQTEQQKTPQK